MDILVTFPDGTTELRAANSLCVLDFESPPRPPHVAKHADIEGWCLDGRIARQIGHVRGSPFSWAWRITGHAEEPYTPTGEWQKVQIETTDEQIARLTGERDAAANALRKYRDAGDYEQVMTFPERGRVLGEARRMGAEALAKIDGKAG